MSKKIDLSKYDIKYLRYEPISKEILFRKNWTGGKIGSFVSIRPVGDEYAGKTFLGVYLGDMPLGFQGSIEDSDTLVISLGHNNPAIFVPALNEIIFGIESWWGLIKSPDDLKQITDEDINSVWYVQALKALSDEKV